MDTQSHSLSIIKKNRITIIAVLAFVVAFACIFAFAGNDSDIVSTPSAESVNESSEPDNTVSSEPVDTGTSFDPEVVTLYGAGLYVDGYFIATVSEPSVAETVLAELLDIRVASLNIDPSAESSFVNEIEIIPGEYPLITFVDKDQVTTLVSGKVTDYTGEQLPVKFSVSSVYTYSETVTLEYETKTIYTDALANGRQKVVSKGYNGEGIETYQIVSVDGVPTEQTVLSLEVTSEPSDRVVRVGTRCTNKTVASLATFSKPYDGIISSYTGPRWGRTHNGLDIVAAEGSCNRDPAYAAADGVVVKAEWYGGYGNCVIIDHGDGIQTLYGHFYKLTVSEGDVVKAGDQVGLIGSTGNSTGPHLHFEVRVDGEFVNPLIFVDYE